MRTQNALFRVVPPAAFCGLVAVVVSLPLLFLLHRALGLGSPPLSGLLLLGATVIGSFCLAATLGAFLGRTNGNPWLAALLGFVLGTGVCLTVAPFYGGLVVQGLTGDATGLVWEQRGQLESAARGAALDRAGETLRAAREGRLRQQLETYRQQAADATTPQSRDQAIRLAAGKAKELAQLGGSKALALLKLGAARLSAFGLLLWVLIGSPIWAVVGCRRAR